MRIESVFKKSLLGLYSSLKRFPESISLATAATLLLIVLTHNEQYLGSDSRDILARIIMVLALGVPLSMCIKLAFERNPQITVSIKAGIYFSAAAALLLFYLFLLKDFEMVSVTRYIALCTSLCLAFLFIPYFYWRLGFELYVIKLFTRLFITIIYSVVLFAGLAAILFTIDKLLGVPVSEKVYLEIWLGVAGIFASTFFLAGIPGCAENFKTSDYPRIFKVLLLYIVMPILSVYTVILYIYFAKIIITLQWPVGLVAHLVLWYSVVCAGIVFFISPLSSENIWARLFIFWLSKLILPLIIMMFVSIGIRINAYGVTENRYFVVVLGLWAFCVMAMIGLTGIRRNITLPISLSLIALLSVFGPWSSYSVSKFSQNMRLESILSKYEMLKDGKIAQPGRDVSERDQQEVSEIIRYFSNSHDLNDVRVLPRDFKTDQMQTLMGFALKESGYKSNEFRHFSYIANTNGRPLDIKGYDYLFMVRSYNSSIYKSDNKLEVKFDNSNYIVSISSGGRKLYEHSLMEFGKQLQNKYGITDIHDMNPDELTFVDENDKVRVKIILQNIYGNNSGTGGNPRIDTMEFYILVSLK